jgi:DNA-binding NtrC family response regulator
VRELRNIVEGAFSLSPSNRIPSSPAAQKLLDTLKSSNHKTLNPREQSERDTYQFALIRNEGNRRKTASELGVDVKTLRKKIKKYKLNMPR